MMKLAILSTVCLVLQTFSGSEALSGSAIATTADGHVGSITWSFSSGHVTGSNTNKCNIFINDVMNEAGGSVPRRGWFRGPIGAGEWGNPTSSYLQDDSCWTNTNSPQVGDVMGDSVHVAFVTGRRTTTSAASHAVVKNDWGFRSNQRNKRFTYWRYTC